MREQPRWGQLHRAAERIMQTTMHPKTETADEKRRSSGPMVELRDVDVTFGPRPSKEDADEVPT